MGIELDPIEKIVSITNPTIDVSVQELVDAIRAWEDSWPGFTYDRVIDAVGKAVLGEGITTGIVMTLAPDWQIRFWDGVGNGRVADGTVVGGVDGLPFQPVPGNTVQVDNAVASTIVETGVSGLTEEESQVLTVNIPNAVDNIPTNPLLDTADGSTLTDIPNMATAAAQEVLNAFMNNNIGVKGAELSALPWNSDWGVEVKNKIADALNTAIPDDPTANSINERMKAVDELTEPGGAGDLAATRTSTETLQSTVGVGTGSILIDHDYGGIDNYRYLSGGDRPINNATIQAFLKSDYDNGDNTHAYVQGETTTDVRGRWRQPLMLDPDTYVLIFFKQGSFGPDITTLTLA